MTLIKTFPSWDPDAVKAAAGAASTAPVAAPSGPTILDSTDRLHMSVDKNLNLTEATIETFQEIPDSFLRDLRAKRTDQDGKFAPDEIHVASVPVGLFDQWYREGFDIVGDKNITPAMIVAKLRAASMEDFVLTSKIG